MTAAKASQGWLEMSPLRPEREDVELLLLRERLQLLDSQRARAALSRHKFAVAMEHALAQLPSPSEPQTHSSSASTPRGSGSEERKASQSREARARGRVRSKDPWTGAMSPAPACCCHGASLDACSRQPGTRTFPTSRRVSLESSIPFSTSSSPTTTASASQMQSVCALQVPCVRGSSRSAHRSSLDMDPDAAEYYSSTRASWRQAAGTYKVGPGPIQPRESDAGGGADVKRGGAAPTCPAAGHPSTTASRAGTSSRVWALEQGCAGGGTEEPHPVARQELSPASTQDRSCSRQEAAPAILGRPVLLPESAKMELQYSDTEEAETSEASDAEKFLRQCGNGQRPSARPSSLDLPRAHWQQPPNARQLMELDTDSSVSDESDPNDFLYGSVGVSLGLRSAPALRQHRRRASLEVLPSPMEFAFP